SLYSLAACAAQIRTARTTFVAPVIAAEWRASCREDRHALLGKTWRHPFTIWNLPRNGARRQSFLIARIHLSQTSPARLCRSRHRFALFFRIVFGLVNAGLVVRVLWQHLVGSWWAIAPFLFKYAGFSWVKPWPGIWLQFHWIALGVFAFFIAIGFLYRISTVLFFLSHTYFFLLDQGRYVNHLYLIGLFGL